MIDISGVFVFTPLSCGRCGLDPRNRFPWLARLSANDSRALFKFCPSRQPQTHSSYAMCEPGIQYETRISRDNGTADVIDVVGAYVWVWNNATCFIGIGHRSERTIGVMSTKYRTVVRRIGRIGRKIP